MKTAVYHEMGWVAKVEILNERHLEEGDLYQIRVIETLQESSIFKPIENGTEKAIWRGKNADANTGWHLTDIKEDSNGI